MAHLFSQHLFSDGTYEGDGASNKIAALDSADAAQTTTNIAFGNEWATPTFRLFRRVPSGKVLFVEERSHAFGYSEIEECYGAGEYIVYLHTHGREQLVATCTIARRARAASVERSFFDVLSLGVLERMLTSARVEAATDRALVSAITGGWFSTLDLTAPGFFSGRKSRWLDLLPTFHAASDVQIYRAYVAQGLVSDGPLRDHLIDAISKVRVDCEKLSSRAAMTADQTRGKWYLWLDDERNPLVTLAPDNGEAMLGERYQQYVEADLIGVEWKWAKSVEEAIELYETFGHPKAMGLDHDLGEGGTAMAFLRWLADSGHHWPKQWYVHSANPVGRANIESFIRSWERAAGGRLAITGGVGGANPVGSLTITGGSGGANVATLRHRVMATLGHAHQPFYDAADDEADQADAEKSLDHEAAGEEDEHEESDVERSRGVF